MDKDYNISSMVISRDLREQISEKVRQNIIIASYFDMLIDEFTEKGKMSMVKNMVRQRDSLLECNRVWHIEDYTDSVYKRFVKTERCKNKFCLNCKKLKQAQRMKKFMPVLAKYDKDLYFLTLTVPNVKGTELKDTLDKLHKGVALLFRFLINKRDKLKIFNSDKLNCIGAIRVTEITMNRDIKDHTMYHPHVHIALILKDYEIPAPTIENRFSFSRNTGKVRLFTKDEVEIQKLWFYIYNQIDMRTVKDLNHYHITEDFGDKGIHRKTVRNFGYSCALDKFKPGQYGEMFKYMVKDYSSVAEIQEDGQEKQVLKLLSYAEFKTLYFATANMMQLATYGIFIGIKDVEDEEIEEEVNEQFNGFIDYLRGKYSYEVKGETSEQYGISDKIYVSKSKILSYLRVAYIDELTKDNTYVEQKNKFTEEEYKAYTYGINESIKRGTKIVMITPYMDRKLYSKAYKHYNGVIDKPKSKLRYIDTSFINLKELIGKFKMFKYTKVQNIKMENQENRKKRLFYEKIEKELCVLYAKQNKR